MATKKGMIAKFISPLFCWGFWIRDPRSGINIPDQQHWFWMTVSAMYSMLAWTWHVKLPWWFLIWEKERFSAKYKWSIYLLFFSSFIIYCTPSGSYQPFTIQCISFLPPYPPKPVNSPSFLCKEKGSTDENVVQEIPQSEPFGPIPPVG